MKGFKSAVRYAIIVLLFLAISLPHALAQSLDEAKRLNQQAIQLYKQGRYDEAIRIAKEVLAIYEKTLGPDHPSTALGLNNLAFLYKVTGRYTEAESLYKRALAIYEKTLGINHPDTAGSLNNLAGLYLESGRLDEGYRILKKQDNPMGLGQYYLLKKDYPHAEKEFNRSLLYATRDPFFLITDHIGLGFSYEGMKDYTNAKKHFREAINITESQWKTLSPDAKKNFLTAQAGAGFARIEAYEGLVRVLIHEKGKGYEKASFTVAESVKGRLFLEMLATREIRGRTKEDEGVIQKDREFQRALMSLRKQLEVVETKAKGVSPEEIDRLRKAISDKEKEYTSFIEEIKLKGGELSSLITADPLSPDKLQRLLDNDTSFLEYMTTKDRTYAWLITKHDIRVYEIPVTEKVFKEKVDTLLLPDISNTRKRGVAIVVVVPKDRVDARTDEERDSNRQQFIDHAKDLSVILTLPIEKDIKTKNLIVVPHGVLHKLPFSLLTDNRYSLSIMPAASVMEFVVNKRKPGKNSLFLIANPATDYTPLEYAEKEGKTISLLFPKKEIYMKDKATEAIVKKRS